VLDQLNATTIKEDGVWIYPEALGGKNSGLAAWWYGGVLQNLDFLTLSPTDPATGVKEQLTQMAWAGELEGWMTSEPRYHLVASPGTSAQWEPVLREGLGQSVEHVEPLSPPQLAAATAARAAQAHPHANLLPAEFSTRYHQQFIDRLWMRGLLAVGGLYLLGVLIYGVALGVGAYRVNRVETRVAELSHSYTNAIQLKARYQILKDRQDLKYAALDCWKAVAELLPDSITLESWNFIDGKKLNLSGTAPPGQVQELLDFDPALRRHLVNGQALFDSTQGDYVTYHTGQGGTLLWGLTLVLKRSEAP
jgi:hypothetical protein